MICEMRFVRVKERQGSEVGTYKYSVNNKDFLEYFYGCHENAAKVVEINHNL